MEDCTHREPQRAAKVAIGNRNISGNITYYTDGITDPAANATGATVNS